MSACPLMVSSSWHPDLSSGHPGSPADHRCQTPGFELRGLLLARDLSPHHHRGAGESGQTVFRHQPRHLQPLAPQQVISGCFLCRLTNWLFSVFPHYLFLVGAFRRKRRLQQ